MSGGFNINNTGKTYETSIEKSAKQNQELIGKLKPMETGSIFDKPKSDSKKMAKLELEIIKESGLFEGETGLSRHADHQYFLTMKKNALTEEAQTIAAQKAALPKYTE